MLVVMKKVCLISLLLQTHYHNNLWYDCCLIYNFCLGESVSSASDHDTDDEVDSADDNEHTGLFKNF